MISSLCVKAKRIKPYTILCKHCVVSLVCFSADYNNKKTGHVCIKLAGTNNTFNFEPNLRTGYINDVSLSVTSPDRPLVLL